MKPLLVDRGGSVTADGVQKFCGQASPARDPSWIQTTQGLTSLIGTLCFSALDIYIQVIQIFLQKKVWKFTLYVGHEASFLKVSLEERPPGR